jgi:hypothetical protein
VGRASNRKKAQRQTGQRRRPDAATQQRIRRIVARLQALSEETEGHIERAAAARRTWSGGAEPVPAEAPRWPKGSLGDRFISRTFLREARESPCLADAEIPAAAVIAADPAYWTVATNALVRAVVYDGLGLDHPAVNTLLEVLTPIAEAELAYWEAADAARSEGKLNLDDDKPNFPEQDGPVFILGTCVLRDAVWAAVGEDSLTDIRGVLVPALDDAVPGVDGPVAADALIGAFAHHYHSEHPGDAELLERIGHVEADALANLVRVGAVPPSDVLPAGLTLLSELAQLCRSDSASLLQRTA